MIKSPTSRILFARIGLMHFYNGSVVGDERPVGGGAYNKAKIGHEVYNFRKAGGRLYGYFQPTMVAHTIALERIDSSAAEADVLRECLVILVASRPGRGQVVVGWYGNATVCRNQVPLSPGKPSGFGHFCVASARNSVLLPHAKRRFAIPRGAGGMGQSNVCYPLSSELVPKHAPWMWRAYRYVQDYAGANLLVDPTADAAEEIVDAAEKALARAQGQGFASNEKERTAMENHAMAAAKRRFRLSGYKVEDVSAREAYDLRCSKDGTELHVEVKGTTTTADAILLTRNEVRHACDSRNRCALFVLASIKLKAGKASRGSERILLPWRIRRGSLSPISYSYRLR
jgi:hypothetical protein